MTMMIEDASDHNSDFSRSDDDDDDDDVSALMMATKADWIHHDQCAINAVHIHPDGTRIATAGGDSLVRIWSYGPAVFECAELDTSVEKLLSVLTVHTGGVNCVRWSPSGHIMASAGDDRTVLLWAQTGTNTTKMDGQVSGFPGAGSFPEVYKCLSNLVGHEADVQDLVWSPDCRRLASCSVDNSIIIWNTETFMKIATLTGHTNWVKGLAWDPLDNYLLSQSEDGTCIIWRTDDWVVEHTIRKPFLDLQFAHNYASDINRQIVFRRPSWSPDGQAFVGSYAHHKVFTSPVLTRGSWKKNANFVGHTKPTTVSRFNPVLFRREDGATFYVCAVGSMDASLSLWVTHSKTPIAIFRHFFTQAILDVAWSPDGRTLIASSHDGTVAIVRFAPNDFGGCPLNPTEMDALLYAQQGSSSFAAPVADNPTALLYQKRMMSSTTTTDLSKVIEPLTKVIEPLAKVIEPSSKALDEPRKRTRMDMLMNGSAPSVVIQQQESRTADGKRRIVPVLADSAPTIRQQPPPTETTSPLAASIEGVPVALPSSFVVSTTPPSLTAPDRRHRFVITVDQSVSEAMQASVGLVGNVAVPTVVEVVAASSGKTMLHCSRGSSSLWRATLSGRVAALAANTIYVVALTEQGDMLWMSSSGLRLHPPILLSAAPYHLSMSKSIYALTLCIDGALDLWSIRERRRLHSSNIGLLLQRSELVSATLDDDHRPMVTLANGDVFTYAETMQSWIRIRDDSFAQSELYSVFDRKEIPGERLAPLGRLSMEDRSLATLAHAEHEMATADVIGDATSYRKWVMLFCRQLVMYARESHPIYRQRLEEVCRELIGPIESEERHWASHAASGKVCKRSLLEQMLPIISTNESLQRLAEQLDERMQSGRR